MHFAITGKAFIELARGTVTIEQRFSTAKAQAQAAGRPNGDDQVWDLLASTFTAEQFLAITMYIATETFTSLCAVWRLLHDRDLADWAIDCFRELGTWVLSEGVPVLSSFRPWVVPQHPAPKPSSGVVGCVHDPEDVITAPKTICDNERVPRKVACTKVCGECFFDWCLNPEFEQGVW